MKNYLLLLILCSTVISARVCGQNRYRFIEPNISISCDSNQFKEGPRYSNTYLESEAYDYYCQSVAAGRVVIHIQPAAPVTYPSLHVRDSFQLSLLKQISAEMKADDTLINIDTAVRHLSGFSCTGVSVLSKTRQKSATYINGYHFSGDDYTEINLISEGKELDSGYALLEKFLQGFRSYSAAEIGKEEKEIQAAYTVSVTPAKPVGDMLRLRPTTFLGLVSTKQPLQHRVAQVWISTSAGEEGFQPDENGKLYIFLNDQKKGNITRSGNLILLNSFEKKVKIPFTFTYLNKGPL